MDEFLVQKDARPEHILKTPLNCVSEFKPICKPSKRTIKAFGVLALLVLAWFTLMIIVSPITLCLKFVSEDS